jgi:tetratricopeptide (TPR) repeat protein
MTADYVAWVKQAERCFDQKHYDEAVGLAERALQVNSNDASAHQVVGLVLSERERPQDALPRLARALALQGDLVPAHVGLGRCFYLLDDFDRALHHFETALHLDPANPFAHFNRAMVYLKRGQFREGWLEYEWRWKCGLVKRANIPRPRWDGTPLNGRAIMIHTEQGLGDALQFIRFLPEIKRQGGKVVLACQKALHPLLQTLPWIDEWFPIDEPGAISFDVYAPLLSLPALLGVTEASIPREVPYVHPDRARVERWRGRIQALPGIKVGVCWHGSVTFQGNALRSMSLAQFAALAPIPGVTLVSLQKGPGVEQIEANRANVPMHVFDDLDRDAPFVDSAAIMQHLDLVITTDTAVAHLAGALARPVWVALSMGCDWRWLIGRSDSPWYPTMRLFRQTAFGNWPGVFQEVADALREKLSGRFGGAPNVPVSAGEILDKIVILEIKHERIVDPVKHDNVRRELDLLRGPPTIDHGERRPGGARGRAETCQRTPLGHRGRAALPRERQRLRAGIHRASPHRLPGQ